MFEIFRTKTFAAWAEGLRDETAKARIAARIDRAALGNFGDAASVGGGVSEMRIHYGAGYRLYFTRRESKIVLLLCGGDKSTQKQDIMNARKLAKEFA